MIIGTILELAEPGVTGKIEYRNRDTCLYLDFEVHDIIDLKFFRSDDSNKPEPLRRGQKVLLTLTMSHNLSLIIYFF